MTSAPSASHLSLQPTLVRPRVPFHPSNPRHVIDHNYDFDADAPHDYDRSPSRVSKHRYIVGRRLPGWRGPRALGGCSPLESHPQDSRIGRAVSYTHLTLPTIL